MARNKKAADLAAAKQKKQKMIAIGGFVVLLAVLAFSVPKTLKMMKGPQPVADPPAQTTPTAAPTAAPGAAAPAATPEVAAAELADTGGMPQPSEGQFISFERFASKDPFAQQVDATVDAPAAPAAPARAAGTPEETEQPGVPGQEPATPSSPSSPSTPAAPSTTTPTAPKPAPAEKPKSAVISINGVQETIEVGAAFPKEDEIFELVSLTATSAKIGIAGGSLTGGAATFTIEKGKNVTLQNTADGTQFELLLVSLA